MKPKMPNYGRVFQGHGKPKERAVFAAGLWKETIADLAERGSLTAGLVKTVDRYVRASTEYEFLYPEAMAEGPTLTAESGGQFANQRWHAVGKLNEQIGKLEAALGIPAKKPDGEAKKAQGRASAADDFLD